MSDIQAVNSVLQDLSIANKNKPEKKDGNELGQKAFLKLMITQLEHQDPLSPQDNGQFIAQLAQFSSVESLDRLNNNFDKFANGFMANQALQASSLVGRSVNVATDTARLDAGSAVTALVELPSSTSNVRFNIYSASGEWVDAIDVGPAQAGDLILRWDGQFAELNGKMLKWQSQHDYGASPGNYRFEVTAQLEGKSTQLETYLSANVNSVTVNSSGSLTLNLAGIGSVPLSSVKQINE